MIVNPGNFQGIIIDKKKQNYAAEYISIDQKNMKTSSSVKNLGVHIDDKLNFNLLITKICRSAANQLHALIRLWMSLNFEEGKTLINSYFYSSFNYCPLVWMFSSTKSLKLNLCRKGPYVFSMKTMFRLMRSYCKKLGKRL